MLTTPVAGPNWLKIIKGRLQKGYENEGRYEKAALLIRSCGFRGDKMKPGRGGACVAPTPKLPVWRRFVINYLKLRDPSLRAG
jgi:hypothetical protein